MSTTAMTHLFDYLCVSLTKPNMRWLGEHLVEYAKEDECAKQEAYVASTLGPALKDVKQAFANGKTMPCAYDLLAEL
ncbi:MAG: hypothetical protein MJZ84_01915 [Paludibacteraceae bacterium]|nr:hypothetical protein [Paludibacteraceae bacterium]